MLSLKVNLLQKDTSSGKMCFECPKAHLQQFWTPRCLNYSILYGGAQIFVGSEYGTLSCHPSGACNLEISSRFLEIF